MSPPFFFLHFLSSQAVSQSLPCRSPPPFLFLCLRLLPFSPRRHRQQQRGNKSVLHSWCWARDAATQYNTRRHKETGTKGNPKHLRSCLLLILLFFLLLSFFPSSLQFIFEVFFLLFFFPLHPFPPFSCLLPPPPLFPRLPPTPRSCYPCSLVLVLLRFFLFLSFWFGVKWKCGEAEVEKRDQFRGRETVDKRHSEETRTVKRLTD